MVHSYTCECFDCFRGHTHYYYTAIQSTTTAVYGVVAIYDVRSSHIFSIRTGLKSRLIWDWSAVIHTIAASRSSLYVYIYTCKNGNRPSTCSRMSVHYYPMSYDTCRGTNVWPLVGSKFPQNSWKLDKVDKTRCTWPFQAKNRCDVTLANRRAPGVWFVLGFEMYLFLAPKGPGIPVFGEKPSFFLSLFRYKWWGERTRL